MYSAIPQGSVVNIQGLDCHLPPEGYVVNVLNGKLEHTGVYCRSNIPEECYWERFKLPDWYKDVTKKEDEYIKRRKDGDDPFYDERYENYKNQEWYRRLNGFWFKNFNPKTKQAESIYITGFYYMLLQWFSIDVGYPKFMIPHLNKTRFLQYCIEDPLCMGMIDITKRRFLKTFIGGLFILEYTSRTKMANGALQSKTGNDASKVFSKAIVNPFRRFPRFFRPEYDTSLGINPRTTIRFQQTNVRGKKAEDNIEKDELGSMIDWGSAESVYYDGQKLHRYFGDEWGKTIETNIFDRHEVIRYCLLDEEGRIVGKCLYSTTVEKLDTEKDGVQDAAIQLWEASDQNNRQQNGMTSSGLYRFFQTADEGKYFDIYGYPDVDKTVKDILADRESVKGNQRALSARKRKEPRTIDEAFYSGGEACEFNEDNILTQIDAEKSEPSFWRKMRLGEKKITEQSIYDPKEKTTRIEVYPMDDEKGGWEILEFPNKPNHFEIYGENFYSPLNKDLYQIGVDTTQDDRIAEYGSNPAIVVMKKSCVVTIGGEKVETGMYPVAVWNNPTRMDVHFDHEVLKAAMWYGCKVAYEIDRRTDFLRFFRSKNCAEFLDWTPKIMMNPVKKKAPEPGHRSGDPFQLVQMLQISKWYIDGDSIVEYNGHVHRIKYLPLLQQLLKYNHSDRTKSDLVVAMQMALCSMFGEAKLPVIPADVVRIFPEHQIKSYY